MKASGSFRAKLCVELHVEPPTQSFLRRASYTEPSYAEPSYVLPGIRGPTDASLNAKAGVQVFRRLGV